jgi:hypothetical protein
MSDPSHSETDRSLGGSTDGGSSFFQELENFFTGKGSPQSAISHGAMPITPTQQLFGSGSGDFLNSWTFFIIALIVGALLLMKFV